MDTQQARHEFSRILEVADIPAAGLTCSIAANADEKLLVAARLGLPVIHELSANISAEGWPGDGLRLRGAVEADIEQICVVTLVSFREVRKIDFERCFLPDLTGRTDETEVVIDPISEDEPDVIENGQIDIGELVVETLALALDPYPRIPDAEFAPPESDEITDRSSPFAVLTDLKRSE